MTNWFIEQRSDGNGGSCCVGDGGGADDGHSGNVAVDAGRAHQSDVQHVERAGAGDGVVVLEGVAGLAAAQSRPQHVVVRRRKSRRSLQSAGRQSAHARGQQRSTLRPGPIHFFLH